MARDLPRELCPGVFWLGDCLEQHSQGKVFHAYNAAFLVIGSTASLLVETGHPKDFVAIDRQMGTILTKDCAPLKYLFLTHQETPHAGGLGRLLERYPDLSVHGDIADYHFAFPQFVDRLNAMETGDRLDLGDRQFIAVEPVIRDLRTSLWGFDTKGRVLFPGDGFAYSHYHWDGHCGMTAEEAQSLDLAETSAVFAERALYWTKFADMSIYVDRLEELIGELDAHIVAPTHGLPVL
ncbi:MAG: MBL fold metallo-hydrolase, partial [Hyphomicrobiaceae bacterium]